MEQLRGHREVSVEALAAMGAPNTAYVKPTEKDGEIVNAIHGADGTPLGLAESRNLAFAAIRQHDMEPVDVH